MTTHSKIEVFKNRFRGRRDIVPRYWYNPKTGRSGYSPIKQQDAFVALTNEVIHMHLTGRLILGVYPLLEDNTCNFIAADLDDHVGNKNALEDVHKFYAICAPNNIPLYVLRSKSGRGYHAYIFFKSPVAAWKARLVAHAVLQEANVVRDDSSFDRLFPSQDRLSGKGFGNLIALPFQGKAAKKGNTIFLSFESGFTKPYSNSEQYQIMRSIKRIEESRLNEIISDWNLQSHNSKFGSREPYNYRKPDFEILVKECGFIRHCRDGAKTLSYFEWWAMISNVVRCKNGTEMVHQLSKPYPKYNRSETNSQIEQVLKFNHPISCHYIQKNIADKYCLSCNHHLKITGSPAGFGYKGRDA